MQPINLIIHIYIIFALNAHCSVCVPHVQLASDVEKREESKLK